MLLIDKNAYFPSFAVECVLNVHAELSKEFRQFCFEAFDDNILADDYNLHVREDVEFKQKYEDTLAKYTQLFGDQPDEHIWEPAESKFAYMEEDPFMSSTHSDWTGVTVNLYRLVVAA